MPTKKMSPRRTKKSTRSRGGSSARGPEKLAALSASELQREIERRIQSLQEKRDRLLAELESLESEIAGYAQAGGRGERRGERAVRKRPRNATNLVVALQKLLAKRAMSVTEMSVAVQKAGYRTTSPNFRTIVNQTLINNPKTFKRVSRGVYTAKK